MKITCAIRCLEPDAVKAAMRGLDDESVVRVPYTCRISGQEEDILLLGDILAMRLVTTMPQLEDTAGARILAGLYGTELCECDVATLTGLPDDEVVERLRAYTDRGLLSHRMLHGMHYFRLVCPDARRAVAATLPN